MWKMHILVQAVVAMVAMAGMAQGQGPDDMKHEVPVIKDMQEFERLVEPNPGIFLVLFSKKDAKVSDDFAVLSSMFRGIVFFCVVTVDTGGGEEIADAFGVSTIKTPSLYWFLEDKNRPKKCTTKMKVEPMTNEILNMIVSTISDRAKTMGIGIDGRVKGGEEENSKRNDGKRKQKSDKPAKTVAITGEEEWEQKVLLNPEISMVAFTAPWCGHCKLLKPEWDEASRKLDGEGAQMVWVDATDPSNEALASQFEVKGFPTIFIFPGGAPKNRSSARSYPGERKSGDMVKYALKEVDQTGAPKEIPQLTSQDILEKECKGQNHICVVAALPHILDAGAIGRNRHKELLTRVSKTFRGGAHSFLWFEGGSQPELESALELTFGYPALVAYSLDRHAFAVLHGSFSEKSITSFLHGVTSGRVSVEKMKKQKIPSVETTKPWDGLDAAPPEEEFSLDDIMGSSDDDEEEAAGNSEL